MDNAEGLYVGGDADPGVDPSPAVAAAAVAAGTIAADDASGAASDDDDVVVVVVVDVDVDDTVESFSIIESLINSISGTN